MNLLSQYQQYLKCFLIQYTKYIIETKVLFTKKFKFEGKGSKFYLNPLQLDDRSLCIHYYIIMDCTMIVHCIH